MKNGWQLKKLDEVCIVERGSSPRPIKNYFTTAESGVNWIKIGDTEAGGKYVYSTAQKITPEGAMHSRFVKEGDFILTNSMSFGRPYILKTSGYIHDGWFVLRLKESIDSDYFYHLLSSEIIQSQFSLLANGAIVQNISGDLVKRALLPIAPLPEQRRIVGILDEAFEGIATAKANAEKNHQNARDLFESYRQTVFTRHGTNWVKKPLSELCDIKHGFAFKSNFFTSEGDYVLLTPGNFYETGGYRDRGEKQKYYVGEIPPDYVLNEGDLLVAMTEQAAGLLGSPILVPESDKFLHNQRLGLVTKKPHVPWTNEFFFHVFNTLAVRKKIHDSASGVKVRHTSPTKIGNVVVSFPTLIPEQRAIVATLDELQIETQRLESLYQRKLDALDELKKSILHRAFNGELDNQ